MGTRIPRITGIDPKITKLLNPIKQAVEELQDGGTTVRALTFSDFAANTFVQNKSGKYEFNPDLIVDTTPTINAALDRLQATQTDLSTLASELLETARFGVILGDKVGQEYALKLNVNNHVAGLGIAVIGEESGPVSSSFIIQADQFAVVFPSPEWSASQGFTQGQYCSPTEDSGVGNIIFECTTAGTTGTTEPSWDATPGNTTNDGTAVWTARTIDERVPFIVGNIQGTAGVGINGDLIVDGTILADAIVAGTITANEIAANTITANEIAANTITAAEIAANTITAAEIAAATITATQLAASLVLTQAIELSTDGHIRSGQTAYDTGTGFWLSANSGTPQFSLGNSAGNKVTWNGSTLTVVGSVSGALDASSLVGSIAISTANLAAAGWTFDGAFSATDADTVAWASGTFTSANGASYSITGSNTGNMTARTYIYLDIGTSTTAFQTSTTSTDAIGSGKVLIAVAEDGASEPFFQVFGGAGGINGVGFSGTIDLDTQVSGTLSTAFAEAGLINANVTINADGTLSGAGSGQASLTSLPGTIATGQLAANAVTAAKIAALTITAAEIAASTITGAKIAAGTITASNIAALTITAAQIAANTITANEIAANTITAGQLAATLTLTNTLVLSTNGKMYTAGKTSFADTDAGVFIGYDTTEADYVLAIGNGTTYMKWNGSLLDISGDVSIQQTTEHNPTWTGFSVDPSSDLIVVDTGAMLFIYPEGNTHTIAGTSNAATMRFTVPTPAGMSISEFSYCQVMGFDSNGVQLAQAYLHYDSGWVVDVEGLWNDEWATSGSKGWYGTMAFGTQHTPKYT